MPKIDLNIQPLFKRRIITSVIVAVLLSTIVGATIVLFVPSSTAPVFDLAETSAISKSVSYSNSTVPLDEPFNGTLFQERPFRGDTGWKTEVVDLVYPYNVYSEYTLIPESDGLHITSENDHISFTRYRAVGLEELTNLTFTVDIESTSGFSKVWIEVLLLHMDAPVMYQVSEDRFEDLWFRDAVNLTDTASRTLHVNVPLNETPIENDYQALDAVFRIVIETYEPGSLIIREANATAIYNTDVFPVKFVPETTDGTSLVENPNFSKLLMNVGLNITSLSTANYSVISIFSPDDLLYLPVGQYGGMGGWFRPGRVNWTTAVMFEVRQDSMTIMEFTVPTLKLEVVLTPAVPWSSLDVLFRDSKATVFSMESGGRNYSYEFYHGIADLYSSPVVELLIPAYEGDLIFDCTTLEQFFVGGFEVQSYEQHINGEANLRLTIRLSYLQVGNMALSVGGMIVMTMYVTIFLIALVILWKNSDIDLRRRLKEDPRVLSAILLFTGTLTPWFFLSTRVAEPFSTGSMNYIGFLGLALLIVYGQGGSALIINLPLWPYLPFALVTLWLPLFAFMHSMRTQTHWELSPSILYAVAAPIAGITLMLPLVLYLGSIVTVSVGAYCCVLSFVYWSVRHLHKRYSKRNEQ